MHTVTALLCFVVVIHWLIFPYPSGLLHWHCGNLTIAPVPAKQPWWIWINTSCEFVVNDCITTTKQSTTKPCAYFLGYIVLHEEGCQHPVPSRCRVIRDNICIYLIMLRHHVGVIKWKHSPRYWPFLRGIHRSPVNSPHKGQWRGTLWFSFICALINGWVNNCDTGDLRRHRAHYDTTVMITIQCERVSFIPVWVA